jgi:hypothetical protein
LACVIESKETCERESGLKGLNLNGADSFAYHADAETAPGTDKFSSGPSCSTLAYARQLRQKTEVRQSGSQTEAQGILLSAAEPPCCKYIRACTRPPHNISYYHTPMVHSHHLLPFPYMLVITLSYPSRPPLCHVARAVEYKFGFKIKKRRQKYLWRSVADN